MTGVHNMKFIDKNGRIVAGIIFLLFAVLLEIFIEEIFGILIFRNGWIWTIFIFVPIMFIVEKIMGIDEEN
jgi:hypothetical protein